MCNKYHLEVNIKLKRETKLETKTNFTSFRGELEWVFLFSFVSWGDFELWMMADPRKNKNVYPQLVEKRAFLLAKDSPQKILWKISKAQVKFMTDHQRDKR